MCYNCANEGGTCVQPFHMMVVESNVFVWKSVVHGYGLFTRTNMQPGDIICLYSGDLRKKNELTGNFGCDIHGNPDQTIDGQARDNYSGKWINHSLTPNARLCIPLGDHLLKCHAKRIAIIVECVRPIDCREEIFINYGKQYFIQEDGVIDPNYFYKSSP